MKISNGQLIVVGAVGLAALAAGKVLSKGQSVSPSPASPRQELQTEEKAKGKFDLTNLPRALELPLVQTPLQPGDWAPDFELPDQYGQLHRLSKLRGQTVVLSFYPRDLTMTCVMVAVSFDRNLPAFQLRGAKVFSVSVQSVNSKALFASRYDISYPLLADTDKTTAQNYRVLSKDGVAGRVTFVIGTDGRILWTDQKVHAQTHAKDVMAFLDSRQAAPRPFVQQVKPTVQQRYAMNSMPGGF